MTIEGKRKTRTDKKIEIKPTLDLNLYNALSRISYITNTPMKTVAETICKNGLYSTKVIEKLSVQFKRDYQHKQTLFLGNKELFVERTKKNKVPTRRITMRFISHDYEKISNLAYSLDTTISTATRITISSSVTCTDIVNEYLAKYIESNLDPARKEQLKLVLQYIEKENPYGEEITLAQLLSYIVDEVKDQTVNLKRTVTDWLDRVTDKG